MTAAQTLMEVLQCILIYTKYRNLKALDQLLVTIVIYLFHVECLENLGSHRNILV